MTPTDTTVLRAAGHTLTIRPGRPLIMGILNLGTDSVADDTELSDEQLRIARGSELVRQGADIIDIGVLSGRTDTAPIPVEEEIALMAPVVQALAGAGVPVSVDTWRAPAAEAALKAGAAIINDTSGLADPQLATLAAEHGAALVITHTLAAPKTESFPGYDDVTADVAQFLAERIEQARALGVADDQLILDPGLDYAKRPAESVELLRHLRTIADLGPALLLAVSRKYFVGMLTGAQPTDRLPGTLAAVGFGVRHGAGIVRVHDVPQTIDYLSVAAALESSEPPQFKGDAGDASLKWRPA